MPMFAVLLGFLLGFLYPAQRNVYVLMVPGGMEGRVTGVYAFSSIVLAWCPPLLFGLCYEATGSMRLGMGVACVWHGASCAVLLLLVDVKRGAEMAARTLDARRRGAGGGGKIAPAEGGKIAPAEGANIAPAEGAKIAPADDCSAKIASAGDGGAKIAPADDASL